ncbi:MAG TPA: KTSC domain-containing protein [Armatimonadaceae bacterium]|nr:KTSC domain-containing protein [Armatimonadaceae bacterium]
MPVRTLKSRKLPMPVAPPSADQDFEIAEPAMPVPVTSSVLRGLCYDIDAATLDVVFRSGAIYRYAGVPSNVAGQLLESGSKGKYFNRFIKGRYLTRRVR